MSAAVLHRGLLALAFVLAATARGDAKLTPPELDGFVVDTSGSIASARLALDRDLAAFQKRTGYSIVVFVTASLDGAPIEDVAYEVFNAWKVGDKGKDNGLLLVVAPTERKIRIETGKGAGGAVTDLQANDIISAMAPLMAEGKVEAAVQLAVRELQVLVEKEVPPPATSTTKKTSKGTTSKIILFGVFGLVLLLGIGLAIRGARRKARHGEVQGAIGTPPKTVTTLEVISGVLKILGSVAGRNKSERRSGGRGGRSGGGGSSGGY